MHDVAQRFAVGTYLKNDRLAEALILSDTAECVLPYPNLQDLTPSMAMRPAFSIAVR